MKSRVSEMIFFVLFLFKAEFKLSLKYHILRQLSVLVNGISTGTRSRLILFRHTHLLPVFPLTTPLALCLAADLAPPFTLTFFPRTASHSCLSGAHHPPSKYTFIPNEAPSLQSSRHVLRCDRCLSEMVSVSIN